MNQHRYFIYLSYLGKDYHGWQIQPNGLSVQEVLMNALSTILRYDVEVVGAGRTDAGVHAKLMVAHIDLKDRLKAPSDFVYKLNSLLPQDVVIDKILPVRENAHARFDALSRTYEYWMIVKKDPFLNDLSARVYGDFDFERMNKAAQVLLEYIDFTSFSKLHTDVKTNNCKVSFAQWQQKDDVWIFTIKADRFLRNMVRAIVGTLLEVGKGKISIEEFRLVVEAKDRGCAGVSAPAEGLYLVAVDYPDEIFLPLD